MARQTIKNTKGSDKLGGALDSASIICGRGPNVLFGFAGTIGGAGAGTLTVLAGNGVLSINPLLRSD